MSRREVTIGVVVISSVIATTSRGDDGRLDLEPESLRPGLMAVYRSRADPRATLSQIDLKPAFSVGDSSPHPRIPAGPFDVDWSGVIRIQDPGPIRFHAAIAGEVELRIDGVKVLQGRGNQETSHVGPSDPWNGPPGLYRLAIRYRAIEGVRARLQFGWEGTSFSPEPIPAWLLSHVPEEASRELVRDQEAARGRQAVGQLGCARCHQSAFPAVAEPPPGPSLADASGRLGRDWVLRWLEDPRKVSRDARMPALFTADRRGFVERWVVSEWLGSRRPDPGREKSIGDHRAGRLEFLGVGCAVCHLVPDLDPATQDRLDRRPMENLGDRFRTDDLAAFVGNPHARYPDGRMPRLPVATQAARDIAAYLLLWSGSTTVPSPEPPKPEELTALARKMGLSGRSRGEIASRLIEEKGCSSCHTGLGPSLPVDLPLRPDSAAGCLSDSTRPRFGLDAPVRSAIRTYLSVAAHERHPSPFEARQRLLDRAGCVRCHQRDSDRPPALESIGQTLGGGYLYAVPYQKTPRLTHPLRKFKSSYLTSAVREGIVPLRGPNYSYRMPAYGAESEALVQALAERDGDRLAETERPEPLIADPTLATLAGPELVGVQGYGCISCHVWDGKQFNQPDPGAVGPDLTRLVGRIRRDWFDRFVENPPRAYPNTPMPAIFPHGARATIAAVFSGEPTKQKDAIWSYLAKGRAAPAPKPPPPLPIDPPDAGMGPLVAQIPIRLPDGTAVESLSLLTEHHDLLIYDMGRGCIRQIFTGARILRNVQGRTRQFLASGMPVGTNSRVEITHALILMGRTEEPVAQELHGYDRLPDGVRLRRSVQFRTGTVELSEIMKLERGRIGDKLAWQIHLRGIPKGGTLLLRFGLLGKSHPTVTAAMGHVDTRIDKEVCSISIEGDAGGEALTNLSQGLPPTQSPPAWEGRPLENPDPDPGPLVRPGYRALPYPRPKTISGEDRVMPAAVAVSPVNGRIFVASLKTGELFTVRDSATDPSKARFENYAGGLFQDGLSMLAESDALYLPHRRNLTRILDTDGDGRADRFDQVAPLPHGVADTYDLAYGLARDRDGAFILSYAPYANRTLPGSGGAIRLSPGKGVKEFAYGMRNPLGWCSGPGGEIFFTDNQGDWVATNKLCHVVEGRFYGFPNPEQKQHASRPAGRAAVWIPYAWAHSVNGVAYDNTGGKFGPFSGQFFLAELMFGGAIVRANVEEVNGQFQGACFPFWGKGLLGPVSLAFDRIRGHLLVGSITEPGWMAQPDRGALFRIDFTGKTPFEVRSIHALPRGFRLVFTKPVDSQTASSVGSCHVDRHRYEYTGAYGSPELDRTTVAIEKVSVANDGMSLDLSTMPLVKDRVYMIHGEGLRSRDGEPLVNPTGAYTLNEIPNEGR